MIFKYEPNDWKELQNLVCQAFQEMGYYAKTEKTIDLVRGKKEIDVYVEDILNNIQFQILVECKNWNSNIPQDIIHSFRTVVNDSGANKGIIIVKKGFQVGAINASDKTPIELLSWDEFNVLYFKKWQTSCKKRIQNKGKELIEFKEYIFGPMHDKPVKILTNNDLNSCCELINKFTELACLANRDILGELDNGSVKILYPGDNSSEINWWTIQSHREWYDYISSNLDNSLKEMKEWKLDYEKRQKSSEHKSFID